MIKNLPQLIESLEKEGKSQEEKELTAYIALVKQDMACLVVILNLLSEDELKDLEAHSGVDQISYAYSLANKKGYNYEYIAKSAEDIVFSELEIQKLKQTLK